MKKDSMMVMLKTMVKVRHLVKATVKQSWMATRMVKQN